MKGLLYFLVIIFANTIGSVSGMGGGVIIKPVLDFMALDSVAAISFYSTVAVFVMSIVSTYRQVKNGISIRFDLVSWISLGAVLGGIFGNILFEALLRVADEKLVQLLQIILTIITLLFAFFYSRYEWKNFTLKGIPWYLLCGLILGFLASFLGIGGGPINVSVLMLMFAMPIKDATVYSICTIFFSQLSKLATLALSTGFARYDLTMLWFVVPAAILGGGLGARASRIFSDKKVTIIFQGIILCVLLINIYNASRLF
ncbi:MAG TPA: sulfite exporter TauE/SafE family protein [Enterococcus sp.]|nr:sulfite exporter TauE/SafE family protein [Enterococcus sp.]HPR80700.1 sulfite exporter TauE/SafE family protein [Enterococcus sp.]